MECGAYLCCGMGKAEGEMIYQKASILSHYTLSTHLIHPSTCPSIYQSVQTGLENLR